MEIAPASPRRPAPKRSARRLFRFDREFGVRYVAGADELHPGWEFATHVGYATPEHRAAIMARGVSPLHRLSFQSMAYQQLAL